MPSSCASEGPVRGPSSLLEGGQRHRSGAPGLTRGCGSVPPFPPFSPLFLPELRSPSGPPSVETPDTLPSSPGSPTQDRDTQPADPGPVTTGLRRPRTPTASLSGVPPALTARPRVSARAHPSLGRGGVRPHGLGVPSDLGGWWASRRCLSELGCKAAHAANCPCARRLGPRPTAAPPAGALSAEGIVGPSSSSVTAAPRACEGSSRNPPVPRSRPRGRPPRATRVGPVETWTSNVSREAGAHARGRGPRPDPREPPAAAGNGGGPASAPVLRGGPGAPERARGVLPAGHPQSCPGGRRGPWPGRWVPGVCPRAAPGCAASSPRQGVSGPPSPQLRNSQGRTSGPRGPGRPGAPCSLHLPALGRALGLRAASAWWEGGPCPP